MHVHIYIYVCVHLYFVCVTMYVYVYTGAPLHLRPRANLSHYPSVDLQEINKKTIAILFSDYNINIAMKIVYIM